MPSFPCVHHIEVGVTDGPRAVNILRQNYTFDVVATRNSKVARQWLLVKSDTRYVVTCLKTEKKELIQNDNYVIDWMDIPSPDLRKRQRKDSVFNVCMQVDNIDQSLARLRAQSVPIYKDIKTLSDSFGSLRLATIKSCIGDVYHTLIEKNNYTGLFLPGFRQFTCACDPVSDEFWTQQDQQSPSSECKQCNEKKSSCCDPGRLDTGSIPRLQEQSVSVQGGHDNQNKESYNSSRPSQENRASNSKERYSSIERKVEEDSLLSALHHDSDSNFPTWTTFDHVAFAVEMGKSLEVLDWYENCLGMKRFLINSEEDNDNGLVLSTDNVGLRLRAMEYWKCSETGLRGAKMDDEGNRLYIVLAEGLPPAPGATEENQIESWLRQHGGGGIQHVALSTGDIKATVRRLKGFGAGFADPPPQAYYSEVGRYYDIQRIGEDLDSLQQHGILVDTEADSIGCEKASCDELNEDSGNQRERYLLQIFTKPIFPKDPFFMEIIQREGATGFGSGNVAALYRSCQAYITGKAKEIEA